MNVIPDEEKSCSFAHSSWVYILGLFLFVQPGAQAQTTILSEGFEGVFPGTNWTVSDLDPEGDPAYWDDVDVNFGSPLPHTGSWMGYCAGFGFAGTSFSPSYQSSMTAVMSRTINLTGYTNATLTFWYSIPSIEPNFDFCDVYVDSTRVWSRSSAVFNMTQATIDLTPYVGGARTLAFVFESDDSVEGEGWYLDDISVTAGGGAGDQPNLTPYQPAGWSDEIVVSKVMDTTIDSSGLLPSDTLYLDWAVINNGSVSVTTSFRVEIYVDDVLRDSWNIAPPLNPNAWVLVTDHNLGTLSAGTHLLRIQADTTGAVAESNENDNEYTKTIVITGSPDIRITPLTLGFNVTNLPAEFAAASEAAASSAESGRHTPALSPEQKLLAAHEVVERFDKGDQTVNVIVNLASPAGTPRGVEWNSKAKLGSWQRAVEGRQDEVLSMLGDEDFKLRHRFENQSGFSGAVTRGGLEKLVRHPRVSSIELSRLLKPHLAQGIPLMNAAIYRSSYNGAGVSVAIVDSGVDYNHPRLGGGTFPNSKVIGGYDHGDNDADPIPNATAHGTACAGIAAGSLGTVGDYIGGVAPNAKIYALKATSSGGSAFDSDIIAAWNWCITHKNDDPDNPILVISTSLGGDRYYSNCDSSQSAYATAANNAVAAGITVLASAGNEGFCDSIGSPACISSIISVGAVFDAAYGNTTFCLEAASCAPKNVDGSCASGYSTTEATQPGKVTRYSNIASFLTLLAPAHRAYTTDIVGSGGYSSGDYATSFGGTSAACPYAAGAVAALQSAAKAALGRFLTPAEIRATLVTTGDLITDTKVAITRPRVNLGRAIETLPQNASFTIFNDGNAPLNVISIASESVAPWLSWSPDAPFLIDPGIAQVVAISVNPALAPLGESTRRLLVMSSDSDESPYPGGVFITVTNIDPRPALTARLVGNRLVVSWPANATGYVLQSADTLPSSSWANMSTTPFVIGSNKYVTNNLTSGNRFYRLRK